MSNKTVLLLGSSRGLHKFNATMIAQAGYALVSYLRSSFDRLRSSLAGLDNLNFEHKTIIAEVNFGIEIEVLKSCGKEEFESINTNRGLF